ncbi:MAG: hypothetical protein D6746_10935 [Bacteroidetes bacterium]|nr:MAG: hypothetical protein D6746_10935 [Bacteroidota bacterium]GIV58586.1 MAG: hypothetical protein KatS3mg042_1499 [Rhodothermaceae bacterium]
MKTAGLTLITLGFLAGAYLAVLDTETVAWGYWGVALVAGFAGVALVRIDARKLAQDHQRVAENIAQIEQSLDNLVTKLEALNAEKERLNPYDVGPLIDEQLLDDLNDFVEARETISHVYGLQAYADVMAHFAGGERYLNRVWSASADGYVDEVNAYLGYALEQFVEARRKLAALKAS